MNDERQSGRGLRENAVNLVTDAVVRARLVTSAPARGVLKWLQRSSGVDWAAEGLLDGVEGQARSERAQLLEQLACGGIAVSELRQAVAEDRLAILPVERLLSGDELYTFPELAEAAGMDIEALRGDLMSLGLPAPPVASKAFDEHDLGAARAAAAFREAGLDERGLRSVGRVVSQGLRSIATASRELIGEAALEPGVGEQQLAVRYAQLAETLTPHLETVVTHALRLHLRDGNSREVIRDTDRDSGMLPDTVRMSLAFADLADFTALSRSEPPRRVAEVADRFAALASKAARPHAQLIKLLGDGALLAAEEPGAAVDASLKLAHTAAQDPAGLPPVRIGIATGPVIRHRGDVYGTPANLAARLSQLAEPGSVVADDPTRDDRPELSWRGLPEQRVKGFSRPRNLFALDTASQQAVN
jgi:adenylate cyclase